MKYFGYKLVLLCTLDGIPLAYDLVPANSDERAPAEEVLSIIWNCDVLCDGGFLGEVWQQGQRDYQGNRIWTPKRVNQKVQNPEGYDRWLNSIRERIKSTPNEVQNTGPDLERLLRKTVIALSTHVIAKMASHALKLILRRFMVLMSKPSRLSLPSRIIPHQPYCDLSHSHQIICLHTCSIAMRGVLASQLA